MTGHHIVRLEESDWARRVGRLVLLVVAAGIGASVVYGVATGATGILVLGPLALLLPMLLGVFFVKRGRRIVEIDGDKSEIRESWGAGEPVRVIPASAVREIHQVATQITPFRKYRRVHSVEAVLEDGSCLRFASDEVLTERESVLLGEKVSELLGVPLVKLDGGAPSGP